MARYPSSTIVALAVPITTDQFHFASSFQTWQNSTKSLQMRLALVVTMCASSTAVQYDNRSTVLQLQRQHTTLKRAMTMALLLRCPHHHHSPIFMSTSG